jgi:equilibrative nucleoside transporter 1/2/3
LVLDLQCSLLVNLFYYQSFFAGLAASGAITSALRLVTKAAFENSRDGLRKGASMLETTMDKFAPVDLYLIYLLAWKFTQCSSPQYRASLSCCVFCYMLSSSLSCQLWSTIVQKQLQRDLWQSLLILLLNRPNPTVLY